MCKRNQYEYRLDREQLVQTTAKMKALTLNTKAIHIKNLLLKFSLSTENQQPIKKNGNLVIRRKILIE